MALLLKSHPRYFGAGGQAGEVIQMVRTGGTPTATGGTTGRGAPSWAPHSPRTTCHVPGPVCFRFHSHCPCQAALGTCRTQPPPGVAFPAPLPPSSPARWRGCRLRRWLPGSRLHGNRGQLTLQTTQWARALVLEPGPLSSRWLSFLSLAGGPQDSAAAVQDQSHICRSVPRTSHAGPSWAHGSWSGS